MAEQNEQYAPKKIGTIAAIAIFLVAIGLVAGSVILSRNMNKAADAVGSSSGLEHQPRPNNIQNQPKRPEGTTNRSGISGDQTTSVPPAGNERR